MEQQTDSKSGKEYVKDFSCHPAYLTYMHCTSWETLGWRKHKPESRLPGEISITSDMQMTPPLWQKVKKKSRTWLSDWTELDLRAATISPLLSSVQLSCSVMSNSFRPHGLQYASFPFLQYLLEFAQTHVHRVGDATQSSQPLVPFSSCLQSFPASGSFQMSQLCASAGQSIGVSASTSVLPMNTRTDLL